MYLTANNSLEDSYQFGSMATDSPEFEYAAILYLNDISTVPKSSPASKSTKYIDREA